MDSERKNIVYKSIMLVLITAMLTFMLTTIGIYNYFTKTDKGVKHILDVIIQDENEIVAKEEAGNTIDTVDLQTKLSIIKAYLNNKYIGELNEEDMIQSAIKGYVKGLGDDYTEYLTKSEYEELLVNVTGDFVGIGIYMTKDNNGNVIVIAPIEDSPAEEAGLQTGDIITKVNGEECYDIDLDVVSNKIKGEEGTKVKLELVRDGEILEKEVERRHVVIKDSKAEVLEGNIGYIQLITFDENSAANVEKYLDEFEAKGINKVILDLRDNTGGIVTEAISLCELFVKKDDIIMKSYDKAKIETVVKSKNQNPRDVKLILLVNEMSASASEITTGALKDNKVATVIGTTTYGKGVMQEIMPIFNKTAGLKLTTEEFLTPNGNKIHKIGIEPDIEVKDNPETEEDEQLERAIQELNS
jgi:carboxyl-terminal processing protease